MDLLHSACGAERPKKSLLARYNGNATVSKFMEAVDEGARTEEELDSFDISPQTGVCYMKAEVAVCCIHRLRLQGYAVVLQPLIPDVGYGYAVNWERWLAKPSVRKASHGRLALLNGVRIFKTGRAAKRCHKMELEAWSMLGSRNACAAPPVLRYRAGLWEKVRALASYIHRVHPYAMFWMEEAAKRSMCADFDEDGQPQLIGCGAKRERDAAMETLNEELV
jgi:hypothetical protein